MADHEDYQEEAAPEAHGPTHEKDGDDEVSIEGLAGEPLDLATHAGLPTVHQDAPDLIATHAGLSTVHQDAPDLIATHAGLSTVHQDAPDLILTHKGDAAAHHVRYTDGEAEIVADTQIGIHAAIATVHQDAPDLILTHKNDPNAHHTPGGVIPDRVEQNLILNAFRIATDGDRVKENLINGIIDAFVDESGIDTGASSNEDYDAVGDFYSPSSGQTMIDRTAGTAIGDMTALGGLAAAFDGDLDQQAYSECAGLNAATVSYIGKDWGVATTKQVGGFKAYASNDIGFKQGSLPTVTITLQGSTDNFSGSIVDLGYTSATDAPSLVISKLSGIDDTAYRYHRLKIEAAPSEWIVIAEAQFFEPGVTDDMTLISEATEAESEPDDSILFMFEEDVDAITVNTDLKGWIGRVDDAEWSQVTLVDVGDYASGKRLLTASVDISGQSSDKTMRWKATTHNNKNLKIYAMGMLWG